VDWILICRHCKFGKYICYNFRDIKFFLGGYFFLARPVGNATLQLQGNRRCHNCWVVSTIRMIINNIFNKLNWTNRQPEAWVTTYHTRFPDFSSRADKGSSIYYSKLLSPGVQIFADIQIAVSVFPRMWIRYRYRIPTSLVLKLTCVIVGLTAGSWLQFPDFSISPDYFGNRPTTLSHVFQVSGHCGTKPKHTTTQLIQT